jgi:hypothetical protein
MIFLTTHGSILRNIIVRHYPSIRISLLWFILILTLLFVSFVHILQESISLILFAKCLLSRVLSLSFLVLVSMLRIGLLSTSIVIYLRLLVLLWLLHLFHLTFGLRRFLLSLIWLTFNLLQPFRVVFFFNAFVPRHPITLVFVFLVVCAMCFLHLVSTLSWPHNLLSVFS